MIVFHAGEVFDFMGHRIEFRKDARDTDPVGSRGALFVDGVEVLDVNGADHDWLLDWVRAAAAVRHKEMTDRVNA